MEEVNVPMDLNNSVAPLNNVAIIQPNPQLNDVSDGDNHRFASSSISNYSNTNAQFSMAPGLRNTMGMQSLAGTSFASNWSDKNRLNSLEDTKKARVAETLRMEEEKLNLLTMHNQSLLQSLAKLEDEASSLQMEKLALEQEFRSMRDQNFMLQTKSRSAETLAKRLEAEMNEKDKSVRILSDQNSELLRLLESEESLSAKLQGEISELKVTLDDIREKYSVLITSAKSHEDLAAKAVREGQLNIEEIRLLRTESEHIKAQNMELKMKTQVEIEAMQEQLRVRKEKQYQLLEKLQVVEEQKRQADDQVTGMEEQLRLIHAKNIEYESQIQHEKKLRLSLEESKKQLQTENDNFFKSTSDLRRDYESLQKENLRIEAEARDNAEKIQSDSEKIFQLLERLKLAELGKTKAMDSLKKKEQDVVSLNKKMSKLVTDLADEAQAHAKTNLDLKAQIEQVKALKKLNQELSQKSKDENLLRIKLSDEKEKISEKLAVTESRLSFLLNKVQNDEEVKVLQTEDRKKLESQLVTANDKCKELMDKIQEMGESNRLIAQAMRLKQEELNELQSKYDISVKELEMYNSREQDLANQLANDQSNSNNPGTTTEGNDSIEEVRANEGRGRFYIDMKSIGGGSLLLLRARKPIYREWLDKHGINDFLKRSQKTAKFRDLVVDKVGQLCALFMCEEEEKQKYQNEMDRFKSEYDILQKKFDYSQSILAVEEDAKRRMLLRYIHSIKENTALSSQYQGNGEKPSNMNNGGTLVLPESNISDEEVHAIAAILRNNSSISEINLKGNIITDHGAHALAGILSGKTRIRMIDLRGNKISKRGIQTIAEALERAERVKHVYVHPDGKIQALGIAKWASDNEVHSDQHDDDEQPTAVEAICVVDVRENAAPTTVGINPYELLSVDTTSFPSYSSQPTTSFHPTQLLETNSIASNKIESFPKKPMKSSNATASLSSNEIIKNTSSKLTKKLKSSSSFEISKSMNDEDKDKLRKKITQDIRESLWMNPSGGLDSSSMIGTSSSLILPASNDGSAKKAKKKKPLSKSLVQLPPLDMNAPGPTNMYSTTNTTNTTNTTLVPENKTEAVVHNLLMKTKKSLGIKSMKTSETEQRLLISPFAQSVIPD